ncbi:hypothetical protein GFS24_00185 [Chitinophaga sp. SYP-B3965]|uniref:hypothetical protein n=1 Tax=Chitinophaga sp. SYP-B3965 TaxID=2663120 RepID=UPI0012997452|nr:hypothetical protein [Chitinophaga sp. SYP-B3965]MRG43506.1 hypothetical protein [Chitinophaga sp. SYP-B3965]
MTRISITFLFVLIPFLLNAQSNEPVEPVVSNDYLRLISPRVKLDDSSYSVRKSTLVAEGYQPGMVIKAVRLVDGKLQFSPQHIYRLAFAGSINTTVELKTINRLPALQDQYGQLLHQHNDVFSYGPALQPGATAYHHPIFRTASLFSQAFNLQTDLFRNRTLISNLDLKLGQSKEQTFIRENENSARNLGLTLSIFTPRHKISGSYSYLDNRFTNSNRNGFLNRVYQNSLLTPVSFSDPYTSYSPLSDNPDFLLQNSGNRYFQQKHNTSLIISRWHHKYEYKLTQSYEKTAENSLEGYKPGTAYFPAGISFQRDKKDADYYLLANGIYRIEDCCSNIKSEIRANYTLQASNTRINAYHYQRTAQQATLNFASRYYDNGVEVGLDAGNRFYFSNTLSSNKYFSPSINLHTRLNGIPQRFRIMANVAYNQYYSELPISESLSYANLLRYNSAQAMQYFPTMEISGYDGLQPVSHREWTGSLRVTYRNKLALGGEVFIRDVQDDLFPVYEQNTWQLKNIADHRKRGIDLSLQLFETYLLNRLFSTTHQLSFSAYNDKVTQVTDGYNYTPVAGFSNVHKAVVNGEVLGAIVGNTYQRDANHQLIVGPDGFPLVNDELSVIGNPIPDFVVKMNNTLRWKTLTLGIDWEWKKGGDVWNGTQAALDYYGRSAVSGIERNTKGYVFPGVTADGHVNTTPVDFYDPAQPVEQNRWVRYGESGVAEAYIQKADHLRINNLQLSWQLVFSNMKFPQKLTVSTYVSNLLLWTAYKGVDPNQVLYDQSNTTGLDFFNLPATKTYGLNVSLQF